MSFFKTTVLYKLFCLIIILSLLIFSCSTDNSITGGLDQTNLSKPSDINSPASDDQEVDDYDKCVFLAVALNPGVLIFLNVSEPPSNFSIPYDFRDNYLSKSKKGNGYITAYYILSNYSIENNLLMKYSSEHLSLMNTGLDFSRELQHSANDNQILINKSIYTDLKDIVKIYRNSENHTDIDIVLDYLETDLEKYYNKTKAEIAVDFE